MTGEREEIRVQRLYVDGHMGRALRRIHDGDRADRVRHVNDLLHRIDTAQHIGYMTNGDQLRFFVDLLLQLAVLQRAIRQAVHIAQRRARLLRSHLPGKHVAVMLHDGDRYLVARMQMMQRVAVRDQIQAFGRIAREDDAAFARRMDKALDDLARLLVLFRRFQAQRIKAAQRVCVRLLIKGLDRLDDAGGTLRRRRVIQIFDRIVHQQREVRASALNCRFRRFHRSSPSSANSPLRLGTVRPECGGICVPAWRGS